MSNRRATDPNDHLPEWFTHPKPLPSEDPSLFPQPLTGSLAEMSISIDDLKRWHDLGWVSFGPQMGLLEPRQRTELVFVCGLARSGLADAQIGQMLRCLPRPLAYDADKLAYSFRYGWVEPVYRPGHEVAEEAVDWIKSLAYYRERQTLVGLLSLVQQQIAIVDVASSDRAPAGQRGETR